MVFVVSSHRIRTSGLEAAFVSLLLAACTCAEPPPVGLRWEATGTRLGARGDAIATAGGEYFVAASGKVHVSRDSGVTWVAADGARLPPGDLIWLGAVEGAGGVPVLLAHVFGEGLLRSIDRGATWSRVRKEPQAALLSSLNPRAKVVPWAVASNGGEILLAGTGGLFRSADAGDTFSEVPISAGPGRFNVLFTGVDARDGQVVAVSQLPDYLLPQRLESLFGGVIFHSGDGGARWTDLSEDLPNHELTAVLIGGDGALYATSLNGGLFRREGETAFESLGGPWDALGLAWNEGGVDVASGSRGLWRHDAGGWTQAGSGPIAGLAGPLALAHDGTVWRLAHGRREPPPKDAGGNVHIALSFHMNVYHSYRGDQPDESGYGMDLRVVRRVLDWLEENPNVHADWDMDNAFTLDGVLAREATDIIERIRARVTTGHDGLRLMSWNNGAVSWQTKEEFDASIGWAKESYLRTFGRFDPGVQPQECMFTPHHLQWYREQGIEWITLFNSASPFGALRDYLDLEGPELYNPLRATAAVRDGSMTLVPVYHQGDLINHGGLASWARQISATHPGDSLLVIHMDADAEVWENFDRQLEPVAALPFVRFTTIQRYLDTHEPVGTHVLTEAADGTGDGYQSWAEKDQNHRFATRIAAARRAVLDARALAPEDAQVKTLAEAALEPRLRALSTTHFGLAAPFLHPERTVTAEAHIAEAERTARAAYERAAATAPVAPGYIDVRDTRARPTSTFGDLDFTSAPWTAPLPTLLEIPVEIPAAAYQGPDGLVIRDAARNEELALAVDVLDASGDPVRLLASTVVSLPPRGRINLGWKYDPATPAQARGSVTAADLPELPQLAAPFTECAGKAAVGVREGEPVVSVDPRGVRVQVVERFALPFCDATGAVERVLTRYEGLAGTVVAVNAQMGSVSRPTDAESVALSPLECTQARDGVLASPNLFGAFDGWGQARLTRRSFDKSLSPDLRRGWNGQAADGWISIECGRASRYLSVAHRVPERTSIAFAPIRDLGGPTVLAPLGALWGSPPWHDARSTGGHGLGDVVVGLIGSQFRPPAPDWSGARIQYRLLVKEEHITPENVLHFYEPLTVFAHPPLVRVGAYVSSN